MAIVEYGPPLSLADAEGLLAAAEAEAAANQWAMVIAVLDSSAHLVALHHMDHAQYASVEVAQAKGRTALKFKRPTVVTSESPPPPRRWNGRKSARRSGVGCGPRAACS